MDETRRGYVSIARYDVAVAHKNAPSAKKGARYAGVLTSVGWIH